jgi:dihydroxy-acid dehydratase
LLHEGDRIRIDAETREISTTADLAPRRANWQPPVPKVTRGALAKYVALVGSASEGATTQPIATRSTSASSASQSSVSQNVNEDTTAGVTA